MPLKTLLEGGQATVIARESLGVLLWESIRAQYSVKAASLDLRKDASQLRRMCLEGDGPRLGDLDLLPANVREDFWRRVRERDHGISELERVDQLCCNLLESIHALGTVLRKAVTR